MTAACVVLLQRTFNMFLIVSTFNCLLFYIYGICFTSMVQYYATEASILFTCVFIVPFCLFELPFERVFYTFLVLGCKHAFLIDRFHWFQSFDCRLLLCAP